MTIRQWIGGGNNQASNPNDWSPTGVPQPGDSLSVIGSNTMNVSDDDLAGNTLSVIPAGGAFVANLSKATMSAFAEFDGTSTFNLAQSSLNLSTFRDFDTVNLSQNSSLTLDSNGGVSTINIDGKDTANITAEAFARPTINLAKGSQWNGTFSIRNGPDTLVVNGAANSVFNNTGNSDIGGESSATINAAVSGIGRFSVLPDPVSSSGFQLEFGGSVSPLQSVADTGLVKIDQPNAFDATVTLSSAPDSPASNRPSEIDLVGLANADSYTFKNDMLNIWSGNKVIDTLRLHDSTAFGFGVAKVGGDVQVVALTSSGETLPGALPIHVGS